MTVEYPNGNSDMNYIEAADDEAGDIHILDFPQLNRKLPSAVLATILKLLKEDDVTNFEGQGSNQERCLSELLEEKGIDIQHFEQAEKWLQDNGYLRLKQALPSLRFNATIFQYLNKVLTSVFASDEEILELASLRISENCGRTAKPSFRRKIKLRSFERTITLNEPSLISDSLGLKTWGSSLVLAEKIVEDHEKFLKEPILELGSGTGLTGIAVGLLGYDVILTDLPEIISNLRENIQLNECESHCDVLDWRDPSDFQSKGHPKTYNTIIIADPIYSPEHPKLVVSMIEQFLARNEDSRVLLQIPIRKTFEKEREMLWTLLDEAGLTTCMNSQIDGYDDFGSQKFIFKQLQWI